MVRRCLAGGASVVAAVLSLGSPAWAGPWPQAKGHGFVISTLSWLDADSRLGNANPAIGDGPFSRRALGFYTEYGLTDQLTFGGSFRLEQVRLKTASGSQATAGVSDVELFARRVLWRQGNSILTAQGEIILPTGYDLHANPALGDGAVGVEPRVLFGRGFSVGDWPSFFDLQAAYRVRFGGPADQIHIDATVGLHPVKGWMLLVQSRNTISERNQTGNGAPGSENPSAHGVDYDLSSVSISAVRDLSPQWSAELGGMSEISGRNYSTGKSVFVSLWRKF